MFSIIFIQFLNVRQSISLEKNFKSVSDVHHLHSHVFFEGWTDIYDVFFIIIYILRLYIKKQHLYLLLYKCRRMAALKKKKKK